MGVTLGGRELVDQSSCGMPKDRAGLFFFLIYVILFLAHPYFLLHVQEV